MTRPPLTNRQVQIIDAIQASVEARGFAPSVRELGALVGLTSTSSVVRQLREMEAKGYLVRSAHGTARALAIVEPDTVPALGERLLIGYCRACRTAIHTGDRFDLARWIVGGRPVPILHCRDCNPMADHSRDGAA